MYLRCVSLSSIRGILPIRHTDYVFLQMPSKDSVGLFTATEAENATILVFCKATSLGGGMPYSSKWHCGNSGRLDVSLPGDSGKCSDREGKRQPWRYAESHVP